MSNSGSASRVNNADFDMIVVGAGFAGMYMLHRARGLGLRVRVYEAGDGVGGTWYWNRYPGARCDVESMEYSYSFSQELQMQWEWTERYATQPEILRYAEHVAERFDLRRDIQFETRVTAAHYDAGSNRWTISTDRGDKVSAQFLVSAVGCLSNANVPTLKGLDSFRKPWWHTGQWPKEGVDFTGKRVGVIGTGSSGIQAIPEIAKQAKELFVFQRTPNYSLPANEGPIDAEEVRIIKSDYPGFRKLCAARPSGGGGRRSANTSSVLEAAPEEREREFESRWNQGGFVFIAAYGDLAVNKQANEIAADFVRRKIRAVVKDPETARLLTPDYTFACKRLCLDTGYFETYNQPYVHLVDIRANPIEELTPDGLRTTAATYDLDCLVFATGFDAMTGPLLAMEIRGRDGLRLADAWAEGPRTYLGLGVAGFPNLFVITGPGSPSVLAVVTLAIEQHVDWIADCIGHMRASGKARIEAAEEAQDAWVAHVNTVADRTLFPTCNSWYLGANIPGKKRVFMPLPGYPAYVAKCNEVAAKGYEGFRLSA